VPCLGYGGRAPLETGSVRQRKREGAENEDAGEIGRRKLLYEIAELDGDDITPDMPDSVQLEQGVSCACIRYTKLIEPAADLLVISTPSAPSLWHARLSQRASAWPSVPRPHQDRLAPSLDCYSDGDRASDGAEHDSPSDDEKFVIRQ
jgi:hypothetical protein